jgi:hypothetical protein
MDGMQTQIHVHNGDATFQSTQDCTPIFEQTQRLHNAGEHGSSEMKHAARLPQIMVEEYLKVNNILFSEFCANPAHIKRMLNDPSLAGFRIWKGRV